MDFSVRKKQIDELDAFLFEKNKLILDIINKVGWREETLQDELKVECPINSDHWVPSSSLSEHVEKCTWVKDGYLREDMVKLSPMSKELYQGSSSTSITIDKETLRNILTEKGLISKNHLDENPDLPKTVDRWCSKFTPAQRLAVYDHVVSEFKAKTKADGVSVEDLMIDFEKKSDQGNKPKSELELLAEQRDYKRRRQSYRAKNVHITKKSYTEVMKEVIENQISYLTETIKQENCDRFEATSNGQTQTNSREGSPRKDPHLPREKRIKREREDSESDIDYRQLSRRNRSPSQKHQKHKHKRSRSRSQSRHHKKSHKHKHKKSKD